MSLGKALGKTVGKVGCVKGLFLIVGGDSLRDALISMLPQMLRKDISFESSLIQVPEIRGIRKHLRDYSSPGFSIAGELDLNHRNAPAGFNSNQVGVSTADLHLAAKHD